MKFYKLSLCALALCAVISCNDANEPTTDVKGGLVFDTRAEQSVELVTRAAVSIAEVTGYTAPSKNDFTFTVIDKYGDTAFNGKIADMTDGKVALDAGTYTVKASYDEGSMGNPIFAGEIANVTINGGSDTAVVVPVTLQNTIVRIEFDEMFEAYYDWTDFTLTSNGGDKALTYGAKQTTGMFVNNSTLTVKATLTSQAQGEDFTSKQYAFEKSFSDIKGGKCYTLKFSASNVGQAGTIQITFGNEISEEDMVDMPTEINPE